MNPLSLNDSDTVTYQELYQAYVNFWNSLNNCVDDEFKIIPANGVKPTFQEAKNLWKSMKDPRRRKLLWVATGFTHSEFPDDEEAFRREEADGLINDTNVTTVDDDSSSDDDISDLDEENIPPVVNLGADGPPQSTLDRPYGGISYDEESGPQDNINANTFGGANDLGLSLNEEFRSETPLLISRGSVSIVADPDPPTPRRSQMNSINLDSPVLNTIQPADVPAQMEISDVIVAASQLDINPAQTSIRENVVDEISQITVDSDSPVPTPQSSLSQTRDERKKITKKRKRVVIDDSDDDDYEDQTEHDEPSDIEEQIASPPHRQPQRSKSPIAKGRKRKSDSPKTAASKPRTRTERGGPQKARKTGNKRGRASDPDYKSDESMLSDDDSAEISTDDESSLTETSSLNGFIVSEDNGSTEESSDEDITLSDSQETRHSEDSSSSFNDEIYTHDDSAERDLPDAPPRAILRNTPTSSKTTPLLAHLGRSRYSSDIPSTAVRHCVATPPSSKPSRIRPADAPADGVGRRRSIDPEQIRSRAAASRNSKQNQAATRTQSPRTCTRSKEGKSGPSTKSQTSSKESPQLATAAPINSGREDSDNSRPPGTSMNSFIAGGYELIERKNKRSILDDLLIITEEEGTKYFRKYRRIGPGYYNNTVLCTDYYCIKCRKAGKETLVKIVKRNNNTYAEYDHHPTCHKKVYNLEDDD